MTIEWIYHKELVSLGHGVEIFHVQISPTRQVSPVAFIEGFTWLKEESERVKVLLLAPDAQVFLKKNLDATGILNETKELIVNALRKPKSLKHGKINQNVFAWFNA